MADSRNVARGELRRSSVGVFTGIALSVSSQQILRPKSVITMNPAQPRAEAVAFDTGTGRIEAVGSLADCRKACPDADERRMESTVLMPGLIQAHDHPVPAALLCQQPAYWIAPFTGYPTWADVEALFAKVKATVPVGTPLMFNGLDRLLLQIPMPDRSSLDGYFPDHPVMIFDITGHAVYFNSPATVVLGWKSATPPADTPNARWLRRPDGTSAGVGFETDAFQTALFAFLPGTIPNPFTNLGAWYANLARNGFTAVGDMAFSAKLLPAMKDLAGMRDCPVRYSLYQVTYDPDPHATFDFGGLEPMIRKQGNKIWMDGSPSIGTAAISVPYLDSPAARIADIPIGKAPGTTVDNYTIDEFASLLESFAADGVQIATHVNGDSGIEAVIDAYERALTKAGITASDHRWRLEHFSIPSREQCIRAGKLGLTVSMSPFQALYWGDLYDGVLFEPSFGARWQPYRDAFDGGLNPSFHNDGYLSPPLPWLNIQNAVTRRSASGTVHAPEQAVSLDEALAAHTINAAWQQKREEELGSIEVGKCADFVELSHDPYEVDPTQLQQTMKTHGTWLAGRRIDLDAFMAEVEDWDPVHHRAMHENVPIHKCGV